MGAPTSPPFIFPARFIWGAATSDHQIEHAQPDDWTAFERRAREAKHEQRHAPGKVLPGHIHAVATVPREWLDKKTDHDRLFDEDFAAAAQIGLRGYRLSLSWARLFPTAETAEPSREAVAFYDAIFASLAKHKLKAFVTLFHFALPEWLAATDASGRSGVERADAPLHFERFARFAVRRFGAQVESWCTLNEPMVYAYNGYMEGLFPPNQQRRRPRDVQPVLRGLEAMHRRAYQALHAEGAAEVGIAQHVRRFVPLRGDLLTRFTAASIDRQFVQQLLDRLADVVDYVGVNYYGRFYVETKLTRPGKFTLHGVHPTRPEDDCSDLGWENDTQGLSATLLRFAKRYGKPLHVLECGIADAEADDVRRQRFLVRHAHAVWQAISNGADVRSFFYWSLLDNFEWAEGFEPRFGLLHVDYGDAFKRTLRPSARVYQDITSLNGLSQALWRRLGR